MRITNNSVFCQDTHGYLAKENEKNFFGGSRSLLLPLLRIAPVYPNWPIDPLESMT